MKILLIKMSSMGDVFHTFPALTDVMQAVPECQVDWVVEKDFAEIPAWHPIVGQVYPIELRKWRRHPIQYRRTIKAFFRQINQQKYDLILDAQGLLKSAWVVHKLKGHKAGLNWGSARESLASLFYDDKIAVDKNQHAIWRLRELFAKALHYDLPDKHKITYGLNTQTWSKWAHLQDNYVVFLHGTTWETKLWPEDYWQVLLKEMIERGEQVVIPWGNEIEKQRALRIASVAGIVGQTPNVWVPETKLSLNKMARTLKFAKQIISVDTGLSHVAAALDTPMVVLYRVTDPEKIGAMGNNVQHLVSPVAKEYVKKFESEQQKDLSLTLLQVQDVLITALKRNVQ